MMASHALALLLSASAASVLGAQAFESRFAYESPRAASLGLTLGTAAGALRVLSVDVGSAAFFAGVKPGDRILAVNGAPPARYFQAVSPSGANQASRFGAAGVGAPGSRDASPDTVRIRVERDEWQRDFVIVASNLRQRSNAQYALYDLPFDLGGREIRSIEVLKGPVATSTYGRAGENGVVVITTDQVRELTRTLLDTARASLEQMRGDSAMLVEPLGNESPLSTAHKQVALPRQAGLGPGEPMYVVDGQVVRTNQLAPSSTVARRTSPVDSIRAAKDSLRAEAQRQVDAINRSLNLLNASTRGVAGAEMIELTYDLGESLRGTPHEGLLVYRVAPDTPAANGHLREGDVIVSAKGVPVRTVESLRTAVEAAQGSLSIRIIRRGMGLSLTLPLR
jgi:TonB-dependent SusC/RagA subfamily outer membrane receptor